MHGCPAVWTLLQAGMPVHSRESSGTSITLQLRAKSKRGPTEHSYPLLHVQQLLTGGNRREADKSCEGLASLCHHGLPLRTGFGHALTLLDQPLQQGKVSVQEHPLQLPARLATTHTLTHTLGSQRCYTEALQHRDKQTQSFSMHCLNTNSVGSCWSMHEV